MENIKFYAVTLLLILAAGFLGYGAISSLRDPVYYVNDQTLATVGDINAGITEPVANETITDTTVEGDTATNSETTTEPTPTIETPTTETTNTGALATNADIKSALQKIAAGTVLKKGSSGDDVKAVQMALNAVAKAGLPTSGSGYGTFGPGTEAAVKKFQTDNKISPASGQVASKTIAALIGKL